MDEALGQPDDISQLWGDADGEWKPAPPRRSAPPGARAPVHPSGNGNGSSASDPGDRLDILEQDVRALGQAVARVEAVVDERLSWLEQQVEDLAAAAEPRAHKGLGRLSAVVKASRNR